MDFDKNCNRCIHYNFNFDEGILCKLTQSKPVFEDVCATFELDIEKEKQEQLAKFDHNFHLPKDKTDLPDMNTRLKKWGIGLIVLGIIHILVSNLFDPIWGAILLVLGVLNLAIRNKNMFLVNGISLLFVGLLNIFAGFREGAAFGWIFFGFLQLLWGGKEIKIYNLFKKEEKENQNQQSLDINADNDSLQLSDNLTIKKHSILGIISAAIFLLIFVLQLISFGFIGANAETTIENPNDPPTIVVIMGLIMMMFFLVVIVGLGLGIGGLFQKDRKKAFSLIGFIGNSMLFLMYIIMFISGCGAE